MKGLLAVAAQGQVLGRFSLGREGQAAGRKNAGARVELRLFAALVVAAVAVLTGRADFEVYFMRHGETSWNRAKVLQGSIAYTDVTSTGVGMAEDSAAEFRRRGIGFDAVYTSPYRRASHTAEIVAASQGLTAKVDARIRERCCGSCEGVRYESGEHLAELMKAADGVEPVEAVGDRAMDFLKKELAPLDGKVKRVLCVGHTLLLSVIEARLRGEREVRKDLLPNCCVHVLTFKDGRFALKERAKVFYDSAKYAGRSKLRYVAHRGAGDLTMPEASRAAYADAVAKSSDIVKLDLQQTGDGVIVMGHDPTLKRVMGWDAKIRDLDYAEILKQGRFRFRKKVTDEQIVRLDEALEIVRPVPEFWLDFKHFDPDFAERVLAAFAAKGIDESRLMVATFSKGALAYFKEKHPSVRRVGHISMKSSDELPRVLAYIGELGLWGVNMPVLKDQTSLAAIVELKQKGAWVSLWFVQDARKAARYRDSGCDAFVTDYVSRVRSAVIGQSAGRGGKWADFTGERARCPFPYEGPLADRVRSVVRRD